MTYERPFESNGEEDSCSAACPALCSPFDTLAAKEVFTCISEALSSQTAVAQRLWSLVTLDGVPIARASQLVDLTESQGYELFAATRRRVRRAITAAEQVASANG